MLLKVGLSGHSKEALPPPPHHPPAQGIVWLLFPRLAWVTLLPRPRKQDSDRSHHTIPRQGVRVL